MSPLWVIDGGQAPPAGRPVLRPPGQSGAEDLAGLQVAPVVFPLGPFPGLAGVSLHLTPRLPAHVELQQSPFFTGGHPCFGALATSNGEMGEGAPKIVNVCEDEYHCFSTVATSLAEMGGDRRS